jgi:hypothetical protein
VTLTWTILPSVPVVFNQTCCHTFCHGSEWLSSSQPSYIHNWTNFSPSTLQPRRWSLHVPLKCQCCKSPMYTVSSYTSL